MLLKFKSTIAVDRTFERDLLRNGGCIFLIRGDRPTISRGCESHQKS
jgi:hypothetical protein